MPAVGAQEVAQLVSAIRFYFDEDSQNRALLKALRSRGVEVTSAGEAGLVGRTGCTANSSTKAKRTPGLLWPNKGRRLANACGAC